MDIADIVSEAYVEFTPETPLSKLVGTFEDPATKGVVVRGNGFEGILTRRTLAASGHQPNEKLGSLARQVPRPTPEEDVRTVARLMIESDAPVLPVFDEEQDGEGNAPIGVVTVDGVLRAVRPLLEAATVAEAYTTDLLSLDPASTGTCSAAPPRGCSGAPNSRYSWSNPTGNAPSARATRSDSGGGEFAARSSLIASSRVVSKSKTRQ